MTERGVNTVKYIMERCNPFPKLQLTPHCRKCTWPKLCDSYPRNLQNGKKSGKTITITIPITTWSGSPTLM